MPIIFHSNIEIDNLIIDIFKSNQSMGSAYSKNKQILQKAEETYTLMEIGLSLSRCRHKPLSDTIDPELKQKVILSSATELVDLIESKLITSLQIVLIFKERASTIGFKNNYIFDEIFIHAQRQAQRCDRQRKQNPHKKNWKGPQDDMQSCFPPFYGVPASYKEIIRMAKKTSNCGYVVPHEKNMAQQENGLFTEMTTKMGFIPFVRTNVPPSCKTNDTNNWMFGYCKNPWIEERSCGGSSGGEGGLIGSYCSPIGFGSDIGGSLRVPAEYNGLMTLKPANRYSRMGNSFYGTVTAGTPVKSDMGPMTRSVKDIELFMAYMCDERNYATVPKSISDPYLNLKPWRSELTKKENKLKIGYVIHLDTLKCSPSHERVTMEAVEILRANGHELVEIQLPRFEELYFGIVQLYSAPGTLAILNEIAPNEPLTEEFKLLSLSNKIPNFVKSMIAWALRSRQPRMVKMMNCSKSMTVAETYGKIYQIQNELTQLVYKQFVDNGIDAVVMPGFAHPSPRCGTAHKLQYTIAYTMGWNVVNYPVGSVPMSLVREDEQHYEDGYNDSVTRAIRDTLRGSEGLPVGVQVVSLPFQEQIVVKLMYELEEKVEFRKNHPCTRMLEASVQYEENYEGNDFESKEGLQDFEQQNLEECVGLNEDGEKEN